jgi:hypothetical protein
VPPRVSLVPILAFLTAVPLAAGQQTQSSAPQPSSSTAPATPASSVPKDQSAKPKKVWTNENLAEASGPISVVGDSKNAPKEISTANAADARFLEQTRGQLHKLRQEIAEDDKQIAALTAFMAGEGSGQADRQLHKGYNSQPVPQQISALEVKKKNAQAKIDALLDEARKRGIQPGDLR